MLGGTVSRYLTVLPSDTILQSSFRYNSTFRMKFTDFASCIVDHPCGWRGPVRESPFGRITTVYLMGRCPQILLTKNKSTKSCCRTSKQIVKPKVCLTQPPTERWFCRSPQTTFAQTSSSARRWLVVIIVLIYFRMRSEFQSCDHFITSTPFVKPLSDISVSFWKDDLT